MTKPPGASVAASLTGRVLHPGRAGGPLLVLDEPVSFWGGVSAEGIVIDVHHPQHRRSVSGTVLAMTVGRGSSSASSVLAEQIRAGVAPAAIVVSEPDVILVLGAVVAAGLYDRSMPILQVSDAELAGLPGGGWAEMDAARSPGSSQGGRRGNARGGDDDRTTGTLVVTRP